MKTQKKSYLHSDHLGTATYVTDSHGSTTQFFLNLPYGETMAEQNMPGDYDNPYKFNGKELDGETGLYYYGARYYDPRVSVWMSVDPLAHKFPHQSPYISFDDNPINKVDPDGRAASPIYGRDGKFLGTDDQGLTGKAIIMNKSDFSQGMSHSEAVKKDLAPKGGKQFLNAFSYYTNYVDFYNHY